MHKSTEKERILVRGTNSVAVKNETKRNGKKGKSNERRKKRSQPNDRSFSVDHFFVLRRLLVP